MNRWKAAAAAAVVVVLLLAIFLGIRALPGPRRPNVLIVLWDTVRADRMSLYGHARPTTPRLEAFARDAVVYERAIAPGMWTLNTHAAMFTGLYESSHGARPAWRWLDGHHRTLAELAWEVGYDTFLYSSNLIASPMTNLTQGFDTVHTSFPRDGVPQGRYMKAARRATMGKRMASDASTELSPLFSGRRDDEWEKSVFKDAAPVAHQALVDWLTERSDPSRPFFAYLNLMEAHTPRLPSESARRRIHDEGTLAVALATDISTYAANEYIIGRRSYSEEQLRAIGATYDAALVDLDDATGDLLDDLSARGLLDDTLVIIVSDHGEHLGEHQRLEHRWSVYEPLLHVPLVIRYPERLRSQIPAGRVSERVNTIDLYATIAEVARLPPAPGPTFSTSLLQRSRQGLYDERVFSQMLDPFASQLRSMHRTWPDDNLAHWARTYCAIYEGEQKLIVSSDGAHELYNLAGDPHEASNLAAGQPQDVARLLGALDAFEARLPAYDPSRRDGSDKPRRPTNEEQALLVIMGYLQDEEESPLRDFCGSRARAGTP